VNRSASRLARPADASVLGSTDPILRSESGEDGGLDRVQRSPRGIPKPSVRPCPVTRRACRVDDPGAQNIGEPVARKTVKSLRHRSTITERLKSDTHCRQSVGGGFDRFAAPAQFRRDHGWRVCSCRFGCPLMTCHTCAAVGGDPGWGMSAVAAGQSGLDRRVVPFGPTRRPLPPGLGPGHLESLNGELPPEDDQLLAATPGREPPGTVKDNRA
jgi:hypothetical protein